MQGFIHIRMWLAAARRRWWFGPAGALAVVAVVDFAQADLSGTYVRVFEGSETELIVHHVGPRIWGRFVSDGGVSFRAEAVSPLRFEGALRVESDCFENNFDDRYVLEIDPQTGALHEMIPLAFGNPNTCEVWREDIARTTLQRRP